MFSGYSAIWVIFVFKQQSGEIPDTREAVTYITIGLSRQAYHGPVEILLR